MEAEHKHDHRILLASTRTWGYSCCVPSNLENQLRYYDNPNNDYEGGKLFQRKPNRAFKRKALAISENVEIGG